MLRILTRRACRFRPQAVQSVLSRKLHDEFTGGSGSEGNKPADKDKLLKPLKKFQIFEDTDSQIILDVEEERRNIDLNDGLPVKPAMDPEISLERGLTGVFEIHELVNLLKKDNAIDICVCKVSRELKYVDYICCITARNARHMRGMAEYVRKVFKLKRHKGDHIPKIEGEKSDEWMAIDLGNIALHIFSKSTRRRYDIEQLWALGSHYDRECNKQDETLAKLEKYSIYLEDLKPRSDT